MTLLLETDLGRRIIPGIEAYVTNPATADPGERSVWAAGKCWLACARENVAVRWLGPVSVHHALAPMRACEECIARLTELANLIACGAPGAPELLPAAAPTAVPLVDVALPPRALVDLAWGERTQPPVPGDENPWFVGFCWLYCDRTGLLVMPIGPVSTATTTVTMYACARCITYLDNLVWGHLYALDAGSRSGRQPVVLARVPGRPALPPGTGCDGQSEPVVGQRPESLRRGRHRRERRLADHLGTPVVTGLARLRRRTRR
ncbi:hypothetical protein [Kitasatospora purpeofusca]|uniref:hypothetical protein n=1 Tax=Kitasatospora purpeofusca TaxID=67352 RepID=UPI002A5AEBA2|nr:hypothetical protein [Kitasatospora purpeofusca]MDY0811474.1 hypothetical protein [Kitasatospora purpeofusca]